MSLMGRSHFLCANREMRGISQSLSLTIVHFLVKWERDRPTFFFLLPVPVEQISFTSYVVTNKAEEKRKVRESLQTGKQIAITS